MALFCHLLRVLASRLFIVVVRRSRPPSWLRQIKLQFQPHYAEMKYITLPTGFNPSLGIQCIDGSRLVGVLLWYEAEGR